MTSSTTITNGIPLAMSSSKFRIPMTPTIVSSVGGQFPDDDDLRVLP